MSGSNPLTFDPTIPLQAGRGVTPVPNPLQMTQQFANTANALNTLKMFPLRQQQAQQLLQQGQIDLTNKRIQSAYGYLSPLLAQPQITHADFTNAMAGLENLGIPTHDILSDVLQNAPTGDGQGFTGYARAAIAARMQNNPQAALGAVTPQTGPMLDNGQSLQPTVTMPSSSPIPGVPVPAGGAYPVYPSRTTLLTQQPGVGPNGEPITTNLANRGIEQGQPGLVGPAGSGPQQPGQPGTLPSANPPIGGPPGSPTDPLRRGASNGAPPGYVTTGLPPGATEAASTSAQALAGAQARAANFQADMLPLQNAYSTLQSGQAFTGLGSETIQNIRSNANTLGRLLGAPQGPWDASTAAYDEARKYLTQVQMAQPGAGRSDAGLNTAGKGSPSTSINPDAAKLILRNMMGLRRMDQAGTLAFSNSGLPANQYQQFMTRWSTQADPRVYQFDLLSPQQRTQLTAGMSAPQLNRFVGQLQQAQAAGLLDNGQ